MIAPIGHAPTATEIDPGEGFSFPMGARPVVAARRVVVAGDGALPAMVREDDRWGIRRAGSGSCAWSDIEFEG